MDQLKIFNNGSTWLRADFHLHTKADKEFNYEGEDNYFLNKYVAGLKKAGIKIGVITNHNKFDVQEFKNLRKKARKEEIYLLSGVELSVNDGANGVHTLIVFSDEWLEGGNDYINQFLNVAFKGKVPKDYEQENGRSTQSLAQTIEALESYHKDFFIVFAHVQNRSGLWHELDGGRLIELGKSDIFKRRTLGFQKVVDREGEKKTRSKAKEWFEYYPAEVHGSDCKNIEQIGKGHKCFLKLGAYNFEAIKYALKDQQYRVRLDEPEEIQHSYIQSISFAGGIFDGETFYLSPSLNTLIGIRGSGKSSILESIRYGLGKDLEENAQDHQYKDKLIKHVLGSGGQITLEICSRKAESYQIRRILNEKPDVYSSEEEYLPGVSILETVISKPKYFGQKDLSKSGEGFEKDLVERLIGDELWGKRSQIEEQKQRVIDAIRKLAKLDNLKDKKLEQENRLKDTKHRLKFFKDHKVDEKLQQRVDFENDARIIKELQKTITKYIEDINDWISDNEATLKANVDHQSKHNKDFFEDVFKIYGRLITGLNTFKAELKSAKEIEAEIVKKVDEFENKLEGLKEQFAEIERRLSESLNESHPGVISIEEYRQLVKTEQLTQQMLKEIKKQEENQSYYQNELERELQRLNTYWHDEFMLIKSELDKINTEESPLKINCEFKGDKDGYLKFLKDIFRGSGITGSKYQNLVDTFTDFRAVYCDLDKAKTNMGGHDRIFEKRFIENLEACLTWQVPNKYSIEYHGKNLSDHSLGQRASALILFILGREENDLVIIDQPEDDLDNQTIYEDVIKLIRSLKTNCQFIFATHNANIPVLGDAEQVIACGEEISCGSIDDQRQQEKIVRIMEGGKEAFNRRKDIYDIWNPQKY